MEFESQTSDDDLFTLDSSSVVDNGEYGDGSENASTDVGTAASIMITSAGDDNDDYNDENYDCEDDNEEDKEDNTHVGSN